MLQLPAFVELLDYSRVEYLVVGGFALAFHGRPRYTGDIDFLIRDTPGNAARLVGALAQLGFASPGLTVAEFLAPDSVVQLGYPPNRIDLLTSISGVDTETVWRSRVAGDLDGLQVQYIAREDLIRNKRASGRPQDLADLDALGAK